jgi:hypothetical protein
MERKMKKLFTLLFVLIAFVSFSHAQMQIGPKLGLNISNIHGDDAGSPDSKTGFCGGLFFMYQFSNMFAIQPEAYYTMKGAKEKEDIEGYTVEATVSLDYIEVPLLLKLIIPIQGSSVHPAVFAGPAVGFNTTHKVKVEVEGQSAEDDIPDVKSTEFSLVFGGGVGFPVGNNELGFDVRYNLGLTTIDDSADEYDVKNNVISFNAYFGFSLH